jgi:hypothetical protein
VPKKLSADLEKILHYLFVHMFKVPMPSKKIPVTIVLNDDSGEEVAREKIDAPGSHTFKDLLPGKTYSATLIPPPGWRVTPPNPKKYLLSEQQTTLTLEVFVYDPLFKDLGQIEHGTSEHIIPDSVLVSVLVVSASFLLLGEIAVFFRVVPSPPPIIAVSPQATQTRTIDRPTNSTNRSPDSRSQQRRQLPPDLEARLRECLQTTIDNRLDLPISIPPNLNDLVPFLIGEEPVELTAPGLQLIQELRAAIEDCDPTLIETIVAATQEQNLEPTLFSQSAQAQFADEPTTNCCTCFAAPSSLQITSCLETSSTNSSVTNIDRQEEIQKVFIAGENVNVRLEPHLNSPIIAQVSHALVQVNLDAIAIYPDWQAVVLPDGTKGYVATQYVDFSVQNQP